MSKNKHRLTVILLAVAVGALLGAGGCCTLGLKQCALTDGLSLVGDAHLNACSGDEDGYPVVVRGYYLTDKAAFESVELRKLWADEREALGASVLGRAFELTIVPGAAPTPWTGTRPQGAVWLALAGNFCKQDGEGWRRLVALDGALTATVRLKDFHLETETKR